MAFEINSDGEVRFSGRTLEEQKRQFDIDTEERIKAIREEIPDRKAKLESAWNIYTLLAAMSAARPSIKLKYYSDWSSIWVECDLDDLPPLSKYLGSLEERSKDVVDAKKKIIQYTRRSRKFPIVYVTYQVKLPKKLDNGEAPKCKIVTKRTVEKVLVCDI